MSLKDKHLYDTLNLKRGATDIEIKKAYKRSALEHHPDKGGSDEMFQEVAEAYQVLSDPIQRRNYDRDLKKYNLKDGQGDSASRKKRAGKSMAPPKSKAFQRTTTMPSAPTQKPKPRKDVNIPENLNSLSVKQLKALIEELGLKHEDCYEKSDLINRVRQAQGDSEPGSSQSQRADPKFNRTYTQKPAYTDQKPSWQKEDAKYETGAGFFPKEKFKAFKIISVGNSEVGKSCLIKRYCEGRFIKRYISTIGIDYGVKKMELSGTSISINFFDLSGNDYYKSIREDFYEDAEGVIMVFDVDNRDSFTNLVQWETEMKRNGLDKDRLQVVVCGNKADGRGREVSTQEANKWCKNRSYGYFETSASTGSNVNEAFEHLFSKVLKIYLDDKQRFGL